jgi:hypothetical protein
MNDFVPTTIIIIIYRILIASIGFAIVFLGYKLFTNGIFGKAGDIDAIWGNRKLLIKRAAPGTLFAIFGAFVICFSVFKGPLIKGSIEYLPPTGSSSPEFESSLYLPAEVSYLFEKAISGHRLTVDEGSLLRLWVRKYLTKAVIREQVADGRTPRIREKMTASPKTSIREKITVQPNVKIEKKEKPAAREDK